MRARPGGQGSPLWRLRRYHRPRDLEEAVELLSREEALPLGGGSQLAGRLPPGAEALVDLSELELSYLRHQEGQLRLGAAATLQQLVDWPPSLRLVGGLLHQAARAAAGRNLREQGTVGGTVGGGSGNDPLLTAFLALDADLLLRRPDEALVPLSDYLQDRRGLILEVRASASPEDQGSYAQVARTPRDQPIVCAAAVRRGAEVRVALGGLGPRPILEEELGGVKPPSNFLGSEQYRRAAAQVLVRRVRAAG